MIFTDDLGRRVELEEPARRIVSLAPAIAENLFAIGAGDLLVGVSTADDYPAPVRSLPRVGDFGKPAYERIRALQPEIVIVEIADVPRSVIKNAERRLNIPVYVQTSRKYDDVARHLKQLTEVTGVNGTGAADAFRKMEAAKKEAAQIARGRKTRPRVFIEVSRSPLWAAGPGSFLDDMIRLAGGVNVVQSDRPFLAYSRESLLAVNPEVYIIAASDPGKADRTLASPLDRIAAAKNRRIRALPADNLFRPTPRLADGLILLAKALSV